MSAVDYQIIKNIDSYIDLLNNIKESINDSLYDLRRDKISGDSAMEVFRNNMLDLSAIRESVVDVFTLKLNTRHYACTNMLKIINTLEKANLHLHEFVDEKIHSGNHRMDVYDMGVDRLVESFRDLNILRGLFNQILDAKS